MRLGALTAAMLAFTTRRLPWGSRRRSSALSAKYATATELGPRAAFTAGRRTLQVAPAIKSVFIFLRSFISQSSLEQPRVSRGGECMLGFVFYRDFSVRHALISWVSTSPLCVPHQH